jgi:hypothetical protein
MIFFYCILSSFFLSSHDLTEQANEDVNQIVHVLSQEAEKWPWLQSRVPHWIADGSSVLIFCTQREVCDKLCADLQLLGFQCMLLKMMIDVFRVGFLFLFLFF